MTPQELINAAERVKKAGVGGFATAKDLRTICEHILDTVRPDDNEPLGVDDIREAPRMFRISSDS